MSLADTDNTALESLAGALLREALNVSRIHRAQRIQSLWGGQGSIWRVATDAPGHESVVLKHIVMDSTAAHPRGWNTGKSFARKAHSYEVECHWYEHYARRCHRDCKVPQMLGVQKDVQCSLLLLEDLSRDYPRLPKQLRVREVLPCLRWLAEFHALFMHEQAEGLWLRGSYWHLDTRPDEWQAMRDSPLKAAAGWLDRQLKTARFQTLVHGDAKLANFCFSQDLAQVAAVDFQYVGQGCGMSDVVYFMGSCLSEGDCRDYEEFCLSHYFACLRTAMQKRAASQEGAAADGQEFVFTTAMAEALEQEWRALFAIAWADFHRFLLGWMPEHPKVNRYAESLAEKALQRWLDEDGNSSGKSM